MIKNVYEYNRDIKVINDFIKHQSKVYKATYLDLYSKFIVDGYLNPKYTIDGIHLSELGYESYLNFLKKNKLKTYLFKDQEEGII